MTLIEVSLLGLVTAATAGAISFLGRVANTSGGSYHPAKAGIFMLC
jgi:hypothetical protein